MGLLYNFLVEAKVKSKGKKKKAKRKKPEWRDEEIWMKAHRAALHAFSHLLPKSKKLPKEMTKKQIEKKIKKLDSIAKKGGLATKAGKSYPGMKSVYQFIMQKYKQWGGPLKEAQKLLGNLLSEAALPFKRARSFLRKWERFSKKLLELDQDAESHISLLKDGYLNKDSERLLKKWRSWRTNNQRKLKELWTDFKFLKKIGDSDKDVDYIERSKKAERVTEFDWPELKKYLVEHDEDFKDAINKLKLWGTLLRKVKKGNARKTESLFNFLPLPTFPSSPEDLGEEAVEENLLLEVSGKPKKLKLVKKSSVLPQYPAMRLEWGPGKYEYIKWPNPTKDVEKWFRAHQKNLKTGNIGFFNKQILASSIIVKGSKRTSKGHEPSIKIKGGKLEFIKKDREKELYKNAGISYPGEEKEEKEEKKQGGWGKEGALWFPGENRAVDAIVRAFSKGEDYLLLVQRLDGKWALPGGFVDENKKGLQAARVASRREAGEESGTQVGKVLKGIKPIFSGYYKGKTRDPRSGQNKGKGFEYGYVTSRAFIFDLGKLPKLPKATHTQDPDKQTKKVKWIPILEALKKPLFADHKKILKESLKKLPLVSTISLKEREKKINMVKTKADTIANVRLPEMSKKLEDMGKSYEEAIPEMGKRNINIKNWMSKAGEKIQDASKTLKTALGSKQGWKAKFKD